MEAYSRMEKPLSLEEGRRYLLRLTPWSSPTPAFTRVTFIAHTASPAAVIVRDERMEQLRCSREDLYLILQ
jgi:hypothetical protein